MIPAASSGTMDGGAGGVSSLHITRGSSCGTPPDKYGDRCGGCMFLLVASGSHAVGRAGGGGGGGGGSTSSSTSSSSSAEGSSSSSAARFTASHARRAFSSSSGTGSFPPALGEDGGGGGGGGGDFHLLGGRYGSNPELPTTPRGSFTFSSGVQFDAMSILGSLVVSTASPSPSPSPEDVAVSM